MEPSLSWLSLLLLVSAAHAVFLATTLVNIQSGPRTANRVLAAVLTILAVQIGFHILTHSHFLLQLPHFSKVVAPTVFILLPLFYFYVKALTDTAFQLTKLHLLHFAPVLIAVAYHMPHYLLSTEDKIAHILQDYEGACGLCHLNRWFSAAQMLAYSVVIIKILRGHARRIEDSFSSVEKINLNWLKLLFVSFSFTWLLSILLEFFTADHEASGYVWLAVSINIYAIGYLGLWQPTVFSGGEDLTRTTSKKKYERSSLPPEKADDYLHKLLDFMKTEKLFLNGDITLQELAKKLLMSHHHLSQIINEKLHQNFSNSSTNIGLRKPNGC